MGVGDRGGVQGGVTGDLVGVGHLTCVLTEYHFIDWFRHWLLDTTLPCRLSTTSSQTLNLGFFSPGFLC